MPFGWLFRLHLGLLYKRVYEDASVVPRAEQQLSRRTERHGQPNRKSRVGLTLLVRAEELFIQHAIWWKSWLGAGDAYQGPVKLTRRNRKVFRSAVSGSGGQRDG